LFIYGTGPYGSFQYDPDFSVLVPTSDSNNGDGGGADLLLLEILLPIFFGLAVVAIILFILAAAAVWTYLKFHTRSTAVSFEGNESL